MSCEHWGTLMNQMAAMGMWDAANDAKKNLYDCLQREQKEKREAYRREEERQKELLAQENAWRNVGKTHPEGASVLAKVIKVIDAGVFVTFDHLKGFIPASEIDEPAPSKAGTRVAVGETIQSIVLQIDEENQFLVLAAKPAIDKRKSAIDQAWKAASISYPAGQVVSARVIKPIEQGVIVELTPRINGFIPTSELDYPPPKYPYGILSTGESIACVVNFVEPKERLILLTPKRVVEKRENAINFAWEKAGKEFVKGKSFNGRVTKVADVGAVVELAENVQGVVPVSELDEPPPKVASASIKVGEVLPFTVAETDIPQKMIVLTANRTLTKRAMIRNKFWAEVSEKYPLGTIVRGRVYRLIEVGAIVDIGSNILGIAPTTELDFPPPENLEDCVSVGDELEWVVLQVDIEQGLMMLATRKAIEKRAGENRNT